MSNKKVLLTGITGFLGSHTAIQLLEKGYHVTGTLRDMKRAESIKKIISQHTTVSDNLAITQADITNAAVWLQLTEGMDYVQHIASPFPPKLPKHEDELILPAKNGMLNVLRAASANKVKRVVITSSSSAITYGRPGNETGLYNESDWTNEQSKTDLTPYFKSKTIAEKAAWDFMKDDTSGMSISVICPGAILGPVLESDFGTSANIIIKMLDGSMPAVPDIGFDLVDVRSVADLLIRGMEMEQAANQRYIGSAGFLKFKDVATILQEAYPQRKIPHRMLIDWLVRLFSIFDGTLKPVLLDLGIERKLDHSKAQLKLNWQPKSLKEAVLSCAASVIELGIVKK